MFILRPKGLILLQELLAQHLPADTEVWASGSHVNGDAYDGSDLNLVLRAAELRELPYEVLSDLREALTESNLPILVDVHDWARLPASFHERILVRYEVLRPAVARVATAA